jgi:hypothetical protein
MKKLILSIGIGTVLMSGVFVSTKTLQNKDETITNVKNVAVGEKEPRLFSTYSVSSVS